MMHVVKPAANQASVPPLFFKTLDLIMVGAFPSAAGWYS